MSIGQGAEDSTHVLQEYDNFILENYTIKELIAKLYNK
jgi:hypothetical protein